MKAILAFLLLLAFPAWAQSPVAPCVTIAGSDGRRSCQPVTSDAPLPVAQSPSGLSGAAVAPAATSAAASNLVLKASAGNLYALQVTSSTTGGRVMLFDATAAPGDGAVTPKLCHALAANTTANLAWSPPLRFAAGIAAVYSSATSCFTKTAEESAFISGQAQ